MRIKELRLRDKLTQNDLAVMLNVTDQTILNWENGLFEPKIKHLIKLADIFNVTIDYLVERKPTNNNVEDLCNMIDNFNSQDFINYIKENLKKMIEKSSK